MDTKQFLETILPQNSVILVATKHDKGFRHRGFDNAGDAAEFIKYCDTHGYETYHACAGYKRAPYKLEGGKVVARTAVNWDCAKAFWCDIDCGEEKAKSNKGYPSQKEAVTELFKWCDKHEFPKPMLVNSGNGVHAYWVMTTPISSEQWIPLAETLKKAMLSEGLLVDPSRSADFSSILRPVGSFNHKDPSNPKEVKFCFFDKPIDTEELIKKIQSFGGSFLDNKPSFAKGEEDVLDVNQAPTSSAEVCAEKCAQMRAMRDTQGDVTYEAWRGVIGVIKFCTEGIELAHKWSAKRAETGHAQTDVDVKFNTWSTGPTTCEHFLKHSGKGCEGCPFAGKIKSPIVLGRPESPNAPTTVEASLEGGTGENVKIELPALPMGFWWDDGKLWTKVFDKQKKEFIPVAFTSTRFYFYDRICDEFGEFHYMCRALLPRGIARDFKVPGSLSGGSPTKLLEELAKYEVNTLKESQGALMQNYVRAEIEVLKNTSSINHTYSHFGWQIDGSFVIGNRRYDADGNTTIVLLGKSATEKARAFPTPIGTLEGYAERVNWIYNRPGMECMQYMICSLWAAPLVEFTEPTYNGIPCALTGVDSGKGKTTAAQVALYAFGRAHPDLSLTGQRGSTAGGQAKFLGVLKNLPMLFDEVTNKTAPQLSTICYELSNGVETMRLRSNGGDVGFAERESWRTQTAMTGNADIQMKLSMNGNAEAEAMRVFEIHTDTLDIPRLDPIVTPMKVAEIAQNQGAAGEAYIKYLVSHRNDLSKMIQESLESIRVDKTLVSQPKYRFYRNHMACTLTAAKIMKELGVIAFDLDKLCAFAINAVRELFETSAQENTTDNPIETLGYMLAAFGGHVATTPTFNVPEGAELYRVTCPKGGLFARAIRSNAGKKDEYDGLLFISSKEASVWCAENRIPKAKFLNELKEAGVLLDARVAITLGRGTTERTAQQRCWKLNMEKLEVPDNPPEESDDGNQLEQGPD